MKYSENFLGACRAWLKPGLQKFNIKTRRLYLIENTPTVTHPMEVIRAFNANNLHTEIVIKGTSEEPLFRASDIGVVLSISNMRAATMHFDETEKIVQIRPHRKTDLPGHEMEMELIELGNGLTYAMLMSIIQNNLDSYNHYGAKDIEALQRENDLLKSIIQDSAKGADCRLLPEPQQIRSQSENPVYMIPTAASSHTDDILQDILNTQKLILDKISNMEKQQSIPQQKTVTNFNLPLATLGPRLQQIDPDTMTLVKWYESMEDFLKQNGFNKFKRPSIAKAIEFNTVYKGFRWSFVDRNEDPNILENLIVTKQTKARSLGYVAKLNQAKSKILAVYLDRKVAAAAHGLSRSALEKPVKTGRIHNGHYYMMYENVNSVLREEFESSIGNELLPFKTKGVEQYDADNNLVRTYSSRQECHETFNIGDRTLNQAIASGMAYNGYVYKLIDPKLFIECV